MDVLICVDRDERYDDVLQALEWCVRLEPEDTALVVHVFPALRFMKRAGDSDPGWSGWERTIVEKARAFVSDTAREMGAHAKPFLMEGDVASELANAAEEHDVGLIVLGAVGQARSQDFLVGSVAENLVGCTERDLLLVRGRERSDKDSFRALLAVDGSEASFAAVASFATKARLDLAECRLVHVMETPGAVFDADLNDRGALGESVLGAAHAEGDAALERARAILARHDVTAEPVLRRGPAAAEIVEEARSGGADVVVVASRGFGRSGPFGGSVARRVARHAPCSVWMATGTHETQSVSQEAST